MSQKLSAFKIGPREGGMGYAAGKLGERAVAVVAGKGAKYRGTRGQRPILDSKRHTRIAWAKVPSAAAECLSSFIG